MGKGLWYRVKVSLGLRPGRTGTMRKKLSQDSQQAARDLFAAPDASAHWVSEAIELGNQALTNLPLNPSLDDNRRDLRSILGNSADLVFREFRVGGENLRALLIYVDGLEDQKILSEGILRTMTLDLRKGGLPSPGASPIDLVKESALAVGEVCEVGTLGEVVDLVLAGNTGLLIDGWDRALIASVKGWSRRAIAEPEIESVVRGPREGFIECLRTNTALIRRKIRSPNLKIEHLNIGRLTRTDVAVVYIQGVANPKIVEEVRRRLNGIAVDGILESGYIEELIEDCPWSPFPQINHTERPDSLAGALLEGRVAIVVDGTPFVLTVPTVFVEFMQAADDYYERFHVAMLIRLLRWVFLNVALLLPALYVAILTFHQEMIPTPLLLSIAAAREGVPFPAMVEALIMEIFFEVLREAGVRLPRPVGQAVSIVGALVIGESAVRAGIVSAPMIIVVAMTGISSFLIPKFSAGISIRLLRFPLLLLAGALGLFGIMIGLLIILIHLCSLRSFGIPYLAPVAPMSPGSLKDTFIRAPWWKMNRRPRLIGYWHPIRQDPGQKPEPPGSRP